MKPTKRKQRRPLPSTQPAARAPGKVEDSSGDLSRSNSRRDVGILLAVWIVLVVVMVLRAKENLSVPGLYYDEAVFAGMTKDFLTGQIHGQHMPGFHVSEIFGRPFPTFVQNYLGALKCWMLLPSFQLFGQTVAVLRASNLFWGCISLLFFMLGTWRWLGLRAALIGGALLALDPTYFFLCLIDWGVAIPSLLCRCVSFFLAALWWQRRQARYIFLTAFFAGLGFFNKIDFAIPIIAVFGAGIAFFGRTLLASLKIQTSAVAFAAGGFLVGGGAMLLNMPEILRGALSGTNPGNPGEFEEKIHTLLALYDGSYFYRLMNVGGIFERMYSEPAGWLPIFGLTLLAAGVVCVVMRPRGNSDQARVGLFFVATVVLATLGVFLLPGAVRVHHSILVYPLPQLIIAFAANILLNRFSSAGNRRIAMQVALSIVFLGLLVSQGFAIQRTQKVIRETGGRGRWSERFGDFCRENKDRTDLTIVSLDWGFNEQLVFLTQGPQLSEPFWQFRQNPPPLPTEPRYLYLVYPAEYSLFPFGEYYLKEARAKGSEVEIRPYLDRQDHVAFYSIQYLRR